MSLYKFVGRLVQTQVQENDPKWMPKWFNEYASFLTAGFGSEANVDTARCLDVPANATGSQSASLAAAAGDADT